MVSQICAADPMDALKKSGGVLVSEWQNERLEGKVVWCFLRSAWNAKQHLASSKALPTFSFWALSTENWFLHVSSNNR